MRMSRVAVLILAPLLLAACNEGPPPLQRQPPAPPPTSNTYNINPALRPPAKQPPVNATALTPIPGDKSPTPAGVAPPEPPPPAPVMTPLQSVAAAPTPPASPGPALQTPPPPPRQVAVTPPPAPGKPAPARGEDEIPTQGEVESLYEGVMLTYSFDACGMPLVGAVARQDIAQRIEVCPNPESRKAAFRTVYQRSISDAEGDPVKTHVNALSLCPDKKSFLQKVMSHANELKFDDSLPPDCGLLMPQH